LKTKLSKEEIALRNNKILEMSKKGIYQKDIAKKIGISPQRVGQIMEGWRFYHKNLKKVATPFVDAVATPFVDAVSKPFSKEKIITAVLDSNMDSNFKLMLVEILLSKAN